MGGLREGVRPAAHSSLSLGTAGGDRLAWVTLTLWLGKTYSPRPLTTRSFRTPVPSTGPLPRRRAAEARWAETNASDPRTPTPGGTRTPASHPIRLVPPFIQPALGEGRRLAGCNAVFLGTGGQGSPFKLTKIEHQPHIIFLKTRFIEVLSVKIAAVWNA